jgi:hypothetical protein
MVGTAEEAALVVAMLADSLMRRSSAAFLV